MLQPRNGAAPADYARLDGAADARATWPALLARDAADWGVNALLFALAAMMEGMAPFEQFLQREALPALSFPLKANTVPSWTLLPTAYALPAAVFLGLHASKRLERRDTAKLIVGLFFACSLTLFVTNATKLAVGCAHLCVVLHASSPDASLAAESRPRPNFAARCWPDGVVSGVPGVPVCSGAAHAVREGRKSFPSGHTSLATAGLGYLAFFLLANVRPRADTGSGAVWRTVVSLSPLFLAAWIGISRVRDYWHHWSDVATGAALGAAIAYTSLQKIAPPRTIAASSQSGEAPAGGPGTGGDELAAPGEP